MIRICDSLSRYAYTTIRMRGFESHHAVSSMGSRSQASARPLGISIEWSRIQPLQYRQSTAAERTLVRQILDSQAALNVSVHPVHDDPDGDRCEECPHCRRPI